MSREKATDLLANYFQAIARRISMPWDPDYTAEIAQAVDEIVEAAVEAVTERIDRLEHRIDVPDWRDRR